MMKKNPVLSAKLNLQKLLLFDKKPLFGKKQSQNGLPIENSGEKANHIMPEIGECHLAAALIQFELERAKLRFVA